MWPHQIWCDLISFLTEISTSGKVTDLQRRKWSVSPAYWICLVLFFILAKKKEVNWYEFLQNEEQTRGAELGSVLLWFTQHKSQEGHICRRETLEENYNLGFITGSGIPQAANCWRPEEYFGKLSSCASSIPCGCTAVNFTRKDPEQCGPLLWPIHQSCK